MTFTYTNNNDRPASMTDAQVVDARLRAAAKFGVPVEQVQGPFGHATKPTKPGVYLRISARSGNLMWANFNGQAWGLYSNRYPGRAMERSTRRSKKALPWFGVSKAVNCGEVAVDRSKNALSKYASRA